MSRSSDEIREEIAATRARIDQDIDALQGKLRRTTDLSSYTEKHLMPLVAGAVGLGLLIAAIFVRRREEEEPPLPAKGTHRRKVAQTIEHAQQEGLIDEDARRVLVSLLTAQGLKWLRDYVEDETRKVGAAAHHKGAEVAQSAATRLHETSEAVSGGVDAGLHRAETRVSDTASSVKETLAEAAHGVGEVLSHAKESVAERAHSAQELLAEAASSAADKAHDTQARLADKVAQGREQAADSGAAVAEEAAAQVQSAEATLAAAASHSSEAMRQRRGGLGRFFQRG